MNILIKNKQSYKGYDKLRYSKEKIEEYKMTRLGESNINNQGCLMVIDKYNDSSNVIVRFKDNYSATVRTDYKTFKKGQVKNPYYPSICNIGMIGSKYLKFINGKPTKEYTTWYNMICRCYNEKEKEKHPTYQDVISSDEWLLFENFYEWLHEQPNFNKWLNGNRWDLDKDILNKGNQVYRPEFCCLVPNNVNKLFIRQSNNRGEYPIGICRDNNKFLVQCMNPITEKLQKIGRYNNLEEAFAAYKQFKESIIKQVAQDEYDKGNITNRCYNAMMNYEVEITD